MHTTPTPTYTNPIPLHTHGVKIYIVYKTYSRMRREDEDSLVGKQKEL
jgi:hypothetical protein